MSNAKEAIKEAEKRMKSAFEAVSRDFQSIRAVRAHPSLLENITVDVYGSKTPLNQVAAVSAPEARMLLVTVWDRANTASVEKAIKTSTLGLNPIGEGTVIRVPLPDLTEERRRDLGKTAATYAEKGRVAVRNVRRDVLDQMKKLEKAGGISEDELRSGTDEVQKKTDKFIADIDAALKKKEADLMG